MQVSRRKVLMIGGVAAAIGLTGGAYTLATPPITRASEPWRRAGGSFGDPRLDALAYAILAPNPHNRQPWVFELQGEDTIDVRCDLNRRLPDTDPFDRQITIGFGCMLELLRMAAADQGFATQMEMFPDGEGQPRLDKGRIARIVFERADPAEDPLFGQILQRRSNKEPYTEQRPAAEEVAQILPSSDGVTAGSTIDPTAVAEFVDIAWRSWLIEYETDRTRRESIDLMRIGNDEVVANPDGIDMGGFMMSALKAGGIVTREELDDPQSTAYSQGIDMYREIIGSARGFAWLTTQSNTRVDQLRSGAAWVRANLAAQKAGLAIHPLSQALQEFPEMAAPYQELAAKLAPDGGTVQMFARVGYGPPQPQSPRWPLEAKLVDA